MSQNHVLMVHIDSNLLLEYRCNMFYLGINSHNPFSSLSFIGYGKRVPIEEFRSQARGGVGVIATKFKKASSEDIASCLHVVKEDDEVLLTTEQGVIVRQNVKDIPSQGRAATGVRVQKIDEDGGDGISSVSIVSKIDDKDDQ